MSKTVNPTLDHVLSSTNHIAAGQSTEATLMPKDPAHTTNPVVKQKKRLAGKQFARQQNNARFWNRKKEKPSLQSPQLRSSIIARKDSQRSGYATEPEQNIQKTTRQTRRARSESMQKVKKRINTLLVKESQSQQQQQPRGPVNLAGTFVPPDGGWGWVCVAVTFTQFFLIDGLTRSYGAIYDDVRKEYPTASHSQVAMVPSILTTLYIGLSLVAGALSHKFTFRSVAFIGAFLCGLSMSFCYFAYNIYILTACFVFAGIGAALITTNCMLSVALYFRRKRAIATGISLSGSSIGSMVQPPLITYLTQYLGVRVALSCFGGLLLLASPTAILLRDPLDERQQRSRNIASSYYHTQTTGSIETMQASVFLDREVPSMPIFNGTSGHSADVSFLSTKDEVDEDEWFYNKHDDDEIVKLESETEDETEDDRKKVRVFAHTETTPKRQGIKIPAKPDSSSTTPEEKLSIKSATFNHTPSNVMGGISSATDSITASVWNWPTSLKHSPSTRRQSIVSNYSAGNFLLLQFTTHSEARYSVYEQHVENRCFLWVLNHLYLNFAFMKNSVFLVVFISSTLCFAAYPGALIFLPPYTATKGVDPTMGSVLISVAAAGDLVARLCCGALLDKNLFPKQYCFIVSTAVLGGSTMLMLCSSHIAYLCVCATIYGISCGLCVLSIPILLADHHGANNLASVFGIVRCGLAFMCLISPPIAGAIRDSTSNFSLSFIFLGGTTILGTLVAMFMPYVKRRYRQKVEADIEHVHMRGEHYYLH